MTGVLLTPVEPGPRHSRIAALHLLIDLVQLQEMTGLVTVPLPRSEHENVVVGIEAHVVDAAVRVALVRVLGGVLRARGLCA